MISIDYLNDLQIPNYKSRSHYDDNTPYAEETDEEYLIRMGYPVSNLTKGNFTSTDLTLLMAINKDSTKDYLGYPDKAVYPKIELDAELLSQITKNNSSSKTIELGEYPQTKVEPDTQKKLEQLFIQRGSSNSKEFKKTGKTYTIPSTIIKEEPKVVIKPKQYNFGIVSGRVVNKHCKTTYKSYEEYEYNNEKYIRFINNNNEVYWLKVLPIKWEIEDGVLYSKLGLFNNICKTEKEYEEIYLKIRYYVKVHTIKPSREDTEQFLKKYFLKDILQSTKLTKTIKYNNIYELKAIIEELKDFTGIAQIILDGPELSDVAMNTIKNILPKEIILSYINKVKDNPTRINKYSNDIEELLDKIYDICNNLPDNTKKSIMDEVNSLLDQYDNDLKEAKPKYGNIYELDIDKKDIAYLKTSLLSNLELIILNLKNEDKTIKLLEKLSKYKRLLSQNGTILVNDDNSTEAKINNIIFILNEMSNSKKETFEKSLISFIDDAINELSKELEKETNDKPDLSLSKDSNIDRKLDLNISKLYDEILSYRNTALPFEKLLNALNKEDNNSSNLIEEIKLIEEKIKELKENNIKYKDDIETRFNNIKEKYIQLITDILNNNDLLKKTNSKEIEISIRKEIQELAKLIKKYDILEVLEEQSNNKYNKDSILKELEESKDIINRKIKKDISKEDESKAITSTVIELNNYIVDNVIEEEIKNEMRNDLINRIDESIKNLTTKDIKNAKEYNKELKNILHDLIVDVGLKIDIYIANDKYYNKHTK
ncbi:MAG: hypothetical protein VZS44_01285 [Bacilli bacterium]|nr:hypothetical protein [Bacilli bacterium]